MDTLDTQPQTDAVTSKKNKAPLIFGAIGSLAALAVIGELFVQSGAKKNTN